MTQRGELYQRDREWHPPALTPNYKTSVARSQRYALLSLQNSVSELTGPTFGHSDFDPLDNDLIRNYAKTGDPIGERITVHGRVLDENARPVPNTLVEIWQANAAGVYPGAGAVEDSFRGWGRVIPDFETGEFSFETVKPSSVMGRNGRIMAPHINLWLVARGINIGLNTRLYFSDDEAANTIDPVLNLVEQAHQRDTLIAKKTGSTYRFDICLQGDAETLFFDI